MIKTNLGFSFNMATITANINQLTNQIWKLIPMKENNENWQGHLNSLILEVSGLGEIFVDNVKYLKLLSKLEGLKVNQEIEFGLYRKTVFESITLLREIIK
jgi:hypothetical protein